MKTTALYNQTLSCNHLIAEGKTFYEVSVKSESIDPFRGVVPSIEYLSCCKDCYKNYLESDLLLLTDEDEMLYLNKGFD